MIDSNELLLSLKEVKLVLGNGFDLHCKLHSSYKDYFKKFKEKHKFLYKKIEQFLENQNNGNSFIDNPITKTFDFEECNIWDYFFALYVFRNKAFLDSEWCDIERMIANSLKENVSIVSWPIVFKIQKETVKGNQTANDLMAGLIYKARNYSTIKNESAFYDFLLSELHEFEIRFGNFIHNQHININRNWVLKGLKNNRYELCAYTALKQICNVSAISSVDVFNYECVDDDSILSKTNFINGDYASPIFGIESIYNENDPRYIFSKTSRRMQNDMDSQMYYQLVPFRNVIVYGHSLNDADYSYFFPVLDRLEISNFREKTIFAFAYSIYDESKRFEIEKSIRQRVLRLFNKYAETRNIKTNLADSLTTQKRILLCEIPELKGIKYDFKTHFDDKEFEEEL